VHFEIIGRDPTKLRSYYGELFGWEFDTGDAATEATPPQPARVCRGGSST
jgi:predicted enzyme related to lactoylglutathione lyase